MGQLLVLFIVLPAVELVLLIELGKWIGTLETIAVIVITGVVGATMARSQGLRVLSRIREETQTGRMPTGSLVDGLIILIASALLVTPGVLTDLFGFLCLLPVFRDLVKRELTRRFVKAVEENRVHVHVQGDVRFQGASRSSAPPFARGDPGGAGPLLDVEPEPSDDSSERGD
jgi:UPF0716 protein FxsA